MSVSSACFSQVLRALIVNFSELFFFKVAVKKKAPKKPESIWKDDDFKENAGVVIKDEGDDRPAPEYDVLFKQSVGGTNFGGKHALRH